MPEILCGSLSIRSDESTLSRKRLGYLVKEESSFLLSIQGLIDLSKEKGAD
jgi:hypothetical protein